MKCHRVIPALLHRANSYPHWIDKELFYEMKSAILRQHGKEDGFDVQSFAGQICWSCDDGVFYHPSGDPDTCQNCFGSGWYHDPRWVQLQRWKLGRFVFHSIGKVAYTKENSEAWGEPMDRISGFVKHRDYTFRQQTVAHILLGLIFNWRYLRLAICKNWKQSRLFRFLTRRCITCHRKIFPIRSGKWRCGVCERVRQQLPEEIPF